MNQEIQIGNTPLSISTYSVETSPTKMNEQGLLEIIFCLKGSVRFSYAYEEFTLRAGEFISVDRDAFFLYKGRDNQCVSLMIDLKRYKDRYPLIDHTLFVCEGLEEGTTSYPDNLYSELKGCLISLLKEITDECRESIVTMMTDRIVEMFVTRFNICFYHYGSHDMSPEVVDRMDRFNDYLVRNLSDKITLDEVADEFNLTKGYVSEFIRRYSIGFRGMLGYIRVNKSEEYLLNTDMTINEISEICGFSDPKYYYSFFRQWYHCTPGQFRDRYGRTMPREIEYLPVDTIGGYIDGLMRRHYMEIFAEGKGL